MKTADYLQAVKVKLNITSDYALAKALKVSKQAASKYSKGENVPGPVVGFRIAEIIGDQPAAVIADLEAERAERTGNDEDVDYLRTVLKRLGGAAASILLAAGLGGFSNADAKLRADVTGLENTHRMKKRRKKATPWAGLLPGLAVAI